MALKILNKLRNNFLAGIVVILPIILTILFFRYLFRKLNLLILDPILQNLGIYSEGAVSIYLAKFILGVILISIIILIGFAAKLIIIRKLFSIPERLFVKVPLIGKVYLAIKQLSFAFLGQRGSVFKRVVLVEYPRKGIHSLAFVTSENSGEIRTKTDKNMVFVFIPTTPNPTSGFFLLLPEDEIIPLDMTVADGLKMIISGGSITPAP